MEDNLTSDPVEKTPEQIEAEMYETRESLTEKVAALENQVVGTVKNAAQTLTETVDAVKSFVTTAPEAVSETVEQMTTAVKDGVKRTLDVKGWVQTYPWACVGASLGVGFLGTYLLSGNGSSGSSGYKSKTRSASTASSTTPLAPHPFSSSSPEPGLFDGVLESVSRKVREKVKELTENAIDVAASALNRNLKEHLPQVVNHAASRFIPEEDGSDGRTHPFGRT